jgi:hypothetical protein
MGKIKEYFFKFLAFYVMFLIALLITNGFAPIAKIVASLVGKVSSLTSGNKVP